MRLNWLKLKTQRLTKYDRTNSMFEIGHETEIRTDDYHVISRYAWILLIIAVGISVVYHLYSILELQISRPF